MNATDLPVVRMCDDPDCRGADDCPRVPSVPLFGISDWLPPGTGTGEIERLFLQELAINYATDSAGVRHVLPAGEFTVHKRGPRRFAPVQRPAWAGADHEHYTVIYSGPAKSRDEALAGAPLWTDDVMQARVAALPRVA